MDTAGTVEKYIYNSPNDIQEMTVAVESFDPHEIDCSWGRLRELLKFRRDCCSCIGEIKIQTAQEQQLRDEAAVLRFQSSQFSEQVDPKGIMACAKNSRALLLEAQADFSRDKTRQALLELRYYLDCIYRPRLRQISEQED